MNTHWLTTNILRFNYWFHCLANGLWVAIRIIAVIIGITVMITIATNQPAIETNQSVQMTGSLRDTPPQQPTIDTDQSVGMTGSWRAGVDPQSLQPTLTPLWIGLLLIAVLLIVLIIESVLRWRLTLAKSLYLNRVWFYLQISIAVCTIVALAFTPVLPPFPTLFWGMSYVLVVLGILAIPVFGVWLGVAGWHNVEYRYVTFWIALAIGKMWHWLSTGWRGVLLILTATTVLAWFYSQVLGSRRALIEFLTPGLALQVLAVDAIIVVLYWASNARRSIVLLGFADHTGDPNLKASIEGIPNRLRNELASLAKLYQSIESYSSLDMGDDPERKDQDKIPGKNTSDSLHTADIGQSLQGIATSDSKVKLGPVEIPIGFLVAIFGRLVEGPHLNGALQRDGDQLVLLATLTGGGLHGNWRVNQSDLDSDGTSSNDTHVVERLANQLAYRVFTDLEQGNLGSVRWRAVYWFTQGLRAYRDAKQSVLGRVGNLILAEQAFTRAISYDDQFVQSHYNLAVTYLHLRKEKLAQSSFIRAGEIDPSFVDAYHALAEFHWGYNHPDDWWMALYYCDYILQRDSSESRAWRLKALALRRLNNDRNANGGRELRHSTFEPRRAWAIEVASIGAALSWRRLCRAALGDKLSPSRRAITARHLETLGLVLQDANSLSQSVLRQALYLASDDANLWSNIGWALSDEGNFAGAIEAFQTTARMTPEVRYSRYLAWACQRRFTLTNTILKWLRIAYQFQLPAPIATVELWAWGKMLGWPGDYTNTRFEEDVKFVGQPPSRICIDARRVRAVRHVLRKNREKLDALQKLISSDDQAVQKLARAERDELINRLIQRSDFYAKHEWYWSASQIMIQLSEFQHLDDPETLRGFEKAIEWLEAGNFTDEVVSRHLHRELASLGLNIVLFGNLERGIELARILKVAEQAVALEPYDPYSRRLLGQIYVLTHQLDLAEKELTTSLALDPIDPYTVQWLARSYWIRLTKALTEMARKQAAQDAIRTLHRIVKLTEQQIPPTIKYQVSDRAKVRCCTHYWLGRFYDELLDYDAALAHLRIAADLDDNLLHVCLEMGDIYLKSHRYDQVEGCCHPILERKGDFEVVYSPWDERERYKLVEYKALAHLLLATALAESGTDLHFASKNVIAAVQDLKGVRRELNKDRRTKYIAKLHECMGWIGYIAVRENMMDDKLKDRRLAIAARRLKSSASLVADADTYFKLGQVYTERALLDSGNLEHWSNYAKVAYRHARDLDLRGEFTTELDKLLKPAEKVEKPAPRVIELHVKDNA